MGLILPGPIVHNVVGPVAYLRRFYSQLRTFGGGVAVPLGPVSLKSEAAYFTSSSPLADHYVLAVMQLERQAGEWSFVAGYAAQAITQHGALPGLCLGTPAYPT